MKKRLAFLLALILMLTTVTGFAAEVSVDRETGVITISGTADPNVRVQLLVLQPNKTSADLATLTPAQMMGVVEHMEQTKAADDGSYCFVYQNDDGDNYAKFLALVNPTNEPYVTEELTINYYTVRTAGTLSGQIIALTDKSQVAPLITADTATILELNTSFYSGLSPDEKDKVHQALANMTTGGLTELRTTFFDASVVEFINNQTDFSTMYTAVDSQSYADNVFGFEKSSDLYKGLNNPAAMEANVLSKLPATDLASFRELSREVFALAAMENYKYTFTESILTDYNDVLGLDLSLLTALNKTAVYKALAGNTYANKASLATAYLAAVADANRNTVRPPVSGGGGGGGTGGGFQGAGTPGVTDKQNTEEKMETEAVTKSEFTDLPKTHYASEAVAYLKEKGVISGYPDGSFAPDREVNRMEFVKMLVEAFELTKTEETIGAYADLSEDSWYYDYCVAGITNGILTGISETEIGTDLSVKRQDVCVFLARLLEKKGIVPEEKGSVSFSDEESVSDYAKESVALFAQAGIVNGSDGNFYPQKAASRAECAKIIYQVVKEVIK